MIKKLINLCFYNFKIINFKIISIFMAILSIFTIRFIFMELNWQHKIYNMWDFLVEIFLSNSFIIEIIFFISLYFLFNCFASRKKSIYVKIRTENSALLFISRMISIFIFNAIVITLSILLILIIGSIYSGFSLTWDSAYLKTGNLLPLFYSPYKVVFICIFTYSFFVTFLSEIIGFFIEKTDSKIIVLTVTIFYIKVNSLYEFMKYVSFTKYMSIGLREFYLGNNPNNYLTVRQGIIFPVLLAIGVAIALLGIYLLKKNFYFKRQALKKWIKKTEK